MFDHTIGAVLAGGSSSRMGLDKTELEYLGVPFIDHAIATLSLAVREVVVCGGSYSGPITNLRDADGVAGPLGGVLSALEWADGRPVIVCAVDMPLVTVDLVTRLVDPPVGTGQARVAIDSGTGDVQPLCGTYGPGADAVIRRRSAHGDASVFGLLSALEVGHVAADSHTLTNVNTPGDLAALEPRGLA